MLVLLQSARPGGRQLSLSHAVAGSGHERMQPGRRRPRSLAVISKEARPRSLVATSKEARAESEGTGAAPRATRAASAPPSADRTCSPPRAEAPRAARGARRRGGGASCAARRSQGGPGDAHPAVGLVELGVALARAAHADAGPEQALIVPPAELDQDLLTSERRDMRSRTETTIRGP